MKYLFLLLAACILSAFTFIPTSPGYRINGTVTGLPDSTWLYLRTAHPDNEIDSCRIIGGKFGMSGHITEKAVPVYLHTAKYTNYVPFWLENTNISITLKAGEFKKGLISGSATQDEDRRLDQLRKPYSVEADSLGKILDKTKDSAERKSLISRIRSANDKGKEVEKDWVKKYPNSLVSANILDIYAIVWGKETTQALYERLTTEMKATQFGRNIRDYLALNKNPKVGDHYIDFEQMNAEGKAVRLSQIKGKYVLLDFWASWCGPCLEENPNLVRTYARFKDKGFAILGVSMDENKSPWLQAIKKYQLVWENVSDLRGDKNKATLMYGVSAIPANFLIDENGIIIDKNLRGNALDARLEKLLP
ncbi:TlpA disulfide reductase family protein [Mucilaginibacter paludis]|uniref:Alkyl hydroperoxide reductase/ Thiol specific antioxidant/ Mal allergen n=1 Tax=Mucilaginibacter paludis DSM 18603 TaxID=714943 RepID=H1YHG9_9SPHI|nr:TlpA disulfide reductase family protein [Mucilaginibacter paludis]EHQ25503.1 alkyl hydroperoxide reductase/ Thiol specific antioxidant/ Mal allergen [Mucilaginibacter paludis DSM 18603]